MLWNAWTEYKFTCVCVCVCVLCPSLSVNSPTDQTPQRIFTVDILKDADLRGFTQGCAFWGSRWWI